MIKSCGSFPHSLRLAPGNDRKQRSFARPPFARTVIGAANAQQIPPSTWVSSWWKMKSLWVWVNTYRYIFSGMNIHKSQLWIGVNRRYQGFDPSPHHFMKKSHILYMHIMHCTNSTIPSGQHPRGWNEIRRHPARDPSCHPSVNAMLLLAQNLTADRGNSRVYHLHYTS